MSKRVNICVCVYNRQSIIKSSLDSLLKQTYKDYNILVCDGKSLDKTIDVILDYQNNNSNVIAWQTEQEGYINTHNFILNKTDSEYICFVDSDDLVDPQKIEEQVKYLDNNPDVDVVSSSVMLSDKRVLPNTMIELNNEQITEYLKNGNPMLSVCHFQSCMFRRKCLEKFTNKVYFYPEYENGMCGEGFLYTLHFLGYKFALFLGIITGIAQLIPIFGPWIVYWALAIYAIFVIGDISQGILTILWGFVLSLSDMYIRPMLASNYADMPSLILLVGFMAGPYVFGIVGFILGPLILGIAYALIKSLKEELDKDKLELEELEKDESDD